MFKRLAMVAGIIGSVAMVFAAFVPAASAQTPPQGTVIAGRGVLDAHGNGLVAVKGTLDMAVSAGQGILLVKDETGDAFVHVDEHGEVAHWAGFTVYFGFNGNATIVGRGVAVIVVGREIDLHVAGRGWAYLKGNGRYLVNGHGPYPWNDAGGFASISSE